MFVECIYQHEHECWHKDVSVCMLGVLIGMTVSVGVSALSMHVSMYELC